MAGVKLYAADVRKASVAGGGAECSDRCPTWLPPPAGDMPSSNVFGGRVDGGRSKNHTKENPILETVLLQQTVYHPDG